MPDYRYATPPPAPVPYPQPMAPIAPPAKGAFSTDTWVRIVFWIVPLIFMAGTLYVSLQATIARQDSMDAQVVVLSDRLSALALEQRVLQEHVQALRLESDRLQPQMDGLRDQLSGLRSDIAAIRQKLGIGEDRRDR